MTNREIRHSRSRLWGARFVKRYEYLLVYIAIVVTLTFVVALMDR